MSSAIPAPAPCGDPGPSGPFEGFGSVEEFRSKLLCVAWARYRLPRDAAEDIVQTTFATYLQVRHRYTHVEDQRAIVAGIFRNKCLSHIDRSAREERSLRRYLSTPDAVRDNPWVRPDAPGLSPSVLDEIVRRETRTGILKAISRMRPSSRRLVSMLTTGRLRRQDLIRELGVNKNTFDSRLHACRTELRGLLRGNELGAWKARTLRSRRGTAATKDRRGAPEPHGPATNRPGTGGDAGTAAAR